MTYPFKHLTPEIAATIANVALQRERRALQDQDKGPQPLAFGASLDMPRSPEDMQVSKLVRELSPNGLIELTALMWLGRGASGETASMWDELVENAAVQQNSSDDDYTYVASKTPLGEYLMSGLKKLEAASASSDI